MPLNYSIIIPHKDIPDLLQRCLDSIPVRDDVEVIVVDDNSDPQKVEFDHFPRWKGKHYQCFLTKEGKGAGYARNVGLDHAQGRWVIFADSDDFFTEDFGSLLDEMADAEEDVVFFDYINVLSDDISRQVKNRVACRMFIKAYLDGDPSETKLRIYFVVPWCKLVKRDLIERHLIRFDEVKCGNDMYFSSHVGIVAKTIKVSGTIGYAVTSRKGQITEKKNQTAEDFRVRMEVGLRCDKLLRPQYGPRVRTEGILKNAYRQKGFWCCVWFCLANVSHPRVFGRTVLFLMGRMKSSLRSLIAKIPLARPLYYAIKQKRDSIYE